MRAGYCPRWHFILSVYRPAWHFILSVYRPAWHSDLFVIWAWGVFCTVPPGRGALTEAVTGSVGVWRARCPQHAKL